MEIFMRYLLGLILLVSSFHILYLKYRVIFTGKRCRATIVGIADKDCGYSMKGVRVRKHAFIVTIDGSHYETAHGCIFTSLGKRNIGKEIVVYKNDAYGNEVFQLSDLRIEITAAILIPVSVLLLL